MADNITILDGAGVTKAVAAEDRSSVFYQRVTGDVAHDAVDAGYPNKLGGKAVSTPPTAVSAGDRVNLYIDLQGRLVPAFLTPLGDTMVDDTSGIDAVRCTLLTMPQVIGAVAHGTADAQAPVKIGGRAKASLSAITLLTDDQIADMFTDLDGVSLVRLNAPLADRTGGMASATGTTATSVVAALGAGVAFYLTGLVISNTSATAVEVEIVDDVGAANTTIWGPFQVPASTGGVVFTFTTPLPFGKNKAAGFKSLTAATTIKVSFNGFKSKV